MTQNSDPYENAVAERINGILKQEFMIDKYECIFQRSRFFVNFGEILLWNKRDNLIQKVNTLKFLPSGCISDYKSFLEVGYK